MEEMINAVMREKVTVKRLFVFRLFVLGRLASFGFQPYSLRTIRRSPLTVLVQFAKVWLDQFSDLLTVLAKAAKFVPYRDVILSA